MDNKTCPLHKKCGGCQLWNMSYEEQLRFKQSKVIKLLGRFHRVAPITGMENPYHYRNKVQAAFGLTRGGKIISGVYQSSSHRIVNVDNCLTEDETADIIINSIRKMLPDFGIIPYNEDTGKGFLRHVLVKRGFSTGQIMVVFVGANNIFPAKNRITQRLLKRHPEITTVIFNINPKKTSMVLGEREEILFGKGYIEDVLCGCTFRISARSFYQINPVQTEKLYSKAVELAGLTGKETVLDAYCGTGTIGIIASKNASRVLGVELNGDAVRDAISNAKINKIENISFIKADAGEFMRELASENAKPDVVFMDPPRAGSDIPFLSSLVNMSPERVVYISCNPETQARDLDYLVKHGYKVKKIFPFDMFPFTSHVECVTLLTKIHI